ncbi:MAG: hypothetical protein IJY62_04525, partial [Clostridia bacterium]|nr:hypothetical protein [Clostridia bacterium]
MKKTLRQRIVCIPMALGMAATSLFAVGCKKAELRTINEDDLSRWLVGITCHYESDLENNYIERTIKELKKEPLKFTLYYKENYRDLAKLDKNFNMIPTLTLWYIDSNGERIENGELDGVKYYLNDVDYNSTNFEEELGDTTSPTRPWNKEGVYEWFLSLWKHDSKNKKATGVGVAVNIDVTIKTKDTV